MSQSPKSAAIAMNYSAVPADRRELFGHPVGLYVLFFTEMWERFSFYGMKALLILYMLNRLLWSQHDASELMGNYTLGVYAVPVLGGLLADKLLGAYKTVFLGGILLCIGHFLMAFEPLPFFYSALTLIVLGVGCLKPNISTQVGSLYPQGDARRDGAFTIFYMGINLGAFLGPIICGWLRVTYGFHYGFAAAGVGMLVALVFYAAGRKYIVAARADKPGDSRAAAASSDVSPQVTRDRVSVLIVVFAFVILFWMAFEQSANVMNVWADKHTILTPFSLEPAPAKASEAPTAPAHWTIAAEQLQSVNPFWIIALAPVFAAIWVWLDKRGKQPSTPAKMSFGIAAMGAAFVPMLWAASIENHPTRAPLAALPANVKLDEYGATRFSYDAAGKSLVMSGVLTDTDRSGLLAATAPKAFADAVAQLKVESQKRAETAKAGEAWRVSVPVPANAGVSLPADPMAGVTWDASSRVLTTTNVVDQVSQRNLTALAADPGFKTAVDSIFTQSSLNKVALWWLVLHYLIATIGELCLSPVGLSLVTKLAPAKWVGMCMGGWFLATAIANKLGHSLGGLWGTMPPSKYFMIFVIACGSAALLMSMLVRPLKRMMHGVQ